LGGEVISAFIAGLIFMLYPTMQGHLGAGHAGLMVQWGVPILIYALYRLRDGWRYVFLAAVAIELSVSGHILQLIYVVLPLMGVYALWLLLRRQFNALLRLIAAGVIGGAVALIFALPSATAAVGTAAYEETGDTVRYSADLLALNDAYRARSQSAGTAFVDVWEAFASEDGSYSATGPDVDGELVRLRTSDGVHFTKAGARKLAFFADRELQKIVAAVQSLHQAPVPALPPAAGEAAIAPSSGQPPSMAIVPAPPVTIDQMLGIALPETPLLSTLAPRPLQGAVIALTTPPVSAGGVLAGPAKGAGAMSLSFGAKDRLPVAKPGRADDFRLESY